VCDVAQLSPERQALLEPDVGLVVVALQAGDHPGRIERLRLNLGWQITAARQCPLQPLARFAEMAAHLPEAVHRPGQPQAERQVVLVAFERPVEDGAEVVVLAFELIQGPRHVASTCQQRGFGGFGQRSVVLRVTAPRDA
jgi:hypothetical protein